MSKQKSYLILIRKETISVLTLNGSRPEYVKFHGLSSLDSKDFWNNQESFWTELKNRESFENDDKLDVCFVVDNEASLKELRRDEAWLHNWLVEDIEHSVCFACDNNVLLHFPKGKSFARISVKKNEGPVEQLFVFGYSAKSLKKQCEILENEPLNIASEAKEASPEKKGLTFEFFANTMKEYENNRIRKRTPKIGSKIEMEKPTKKKSAKKKKR